MSTRRGTAAAEAAAVWFVCFLGLQTVVLAEPDGLWLRSAPRRRTSASARDEAGDVRAVELEGHPFFIATLFQPERAALTGRSHPLIAAYVAAAGAWSAGSRAPSCLWTRIS